MPWLCVWTLKRGVLDPPEPLDEEHAALADRAEGWGDEARYLAELDMRRRLWRQRSMAKAQRARARGVRMERVERYG